MEVHGDIDKVFLRGNLAVDEGKTGVWQEKLERKANTLFLKRVAGDSRWPRACLKIMSFSHILSETVQRLRHMWHYMLLQKHHSVQNSEHQRQPESPNFRIPVRVLGYHYGSPWKPGCTNGTGGKQNTEDQHSSRCRNRAVQNTGDHHSEEYLCKHRTTVMNLGKKEELPL